jgi:beta-galactosidase
MKREIKLIAILIAILIISGGCRKIISPIVFNDNWQFIISDEDLSNKELTKLNWQNISLPHTPKIEPKVMDGQWQGICWYYKTFNLPEKSNGKKFFIRFEGAMNICEVWVNGEKLAFKQGGYLPVVLDFTKVARQNKTNEILVRLDNKDNPVTGPKPMRSLDFNMYGGLYRDAILIVKDKLHITDEIYADKVASGGVFVTYPYAGKEKAEIEVKTDVLNDYSANKKIKVINEIWKEGKLIASSESEEKNIDSGVSSEIISRIEIKNPELWSPKNPSLYQLKTKIKSNGRVTDIVETQIGIRSIKFSKEGFYINGEKMFLRGVNRHQEYPYVGYAMSNEAQYRDAVKIKEAGFDYIRLSHYPHSPAFMDACDQIGLVVLDAILGWQYYTTDSAFQNHVFQTGRELIRRDRNHPCVVAWELSLNESWMDEPFIDELQKITHEEYPGDQCYSAGWQEYGYDIYLQARQHRLQHYQETSKPYIVSEYGDWEYYAMNAGLNQDSWTNLLQEERSSRQLLSESEKRLLQQSANIEEAYYDNRTIPAIGDGYWVMYDYNRGYSNDLESSGIMSIDRLPKFSYYFFRSQRDAGETSKQYSSGPMVYIATYYNEKSPLNIKVFSNCDEVELYQNGISLGKKQVTANHSSTIFNISEFIKGELSAKGYIAGKEVTKHTVKTPETPVKLELKADISEKEPKAGCNDIIFVYARLVDDNNTVVPENEILVTFNIEGDAEVLNPGEIKTEAGIATALIRIGNTKGEIKVSAKDLNGRTGKISIKAI